MYFSQIGQDKYYIENISKGKRDGYFVEVGANNGIDFSNTYKLEKEYGWKGLCIDVDADVFEALKKNRTCDVAKECVFKKTGESVTIEVPLANPIPEGNSMLTRIKDNPVNKNDTVFSDQFRETKTYTTKTKTLTDIFIEHNVPKVIDYMSIDIQGAELDALTGLDFTKYSIDFLTIEWGGRECRNDYLEYIKTFMRFKNYIVHRINKWDIEFIHIKDKIIVNSFDFWDTLVARANSNFSDIFQAMVDDYGLPADFKYQRMNAESHSDGTIQQIYRNLANHYKWTDAQMEAARKKELLTEMRYIIPITENLNKVAEGDIIVSDNYFTKEDLKAILDFIGFNKKVNIFVSPAGKSSRTIWHLLSSSYSILSHTGDNPYSDIASAESFGIKGYLTTATHPTPFEQLYFNHPYKGFNQIGHLIRSSRLNNPFVDTIERNLWYDMFAQIIPIFIQYCIFVENIARKNNLTKIRFLTRDNQIIQPIFQALFPHYNISHFISSRYLNTHKTDRYSQYIKENYDDSTLLVDMLGSFHSGRELFKSVIGKYPNIVVFVYNEQCDPFDKFNYMFKTSDGINYTYEYEKYTQPYKGKNVGIRNNGSYVNFINEYNHQHVVNRAIQSIVYSLLPIKQSDLPISIDLPQIKKLMNSEKLNYPDFEHNPFDDKFFKENDIMFY